MKNLLVLALFIMFFVGCAELAQDKTQSAGIGTLIKNKTKEKVGEKIDEAVDSSDENALIKKIVKDSAKKKANQKIDTIF